MLLMEMLESNDKIIIVVGAGGKTSFINYFAKYYRDKCKVLLTTTTKIYLLNENTYDNLFMTEHDKELPTINSCGVTVVGKYINHENKIIGLDFYEINKIEDNFELILIEGDGSKKKKLKGWRDYEPVVYPKTNKVIGIVDITSYGMDIKGENIHNLKEFLKITDIHEDKVSLLHLKNMILHKDGLFKNATKDKVLFINKVENENYKNIAKELIKLIKYENSDISIFYGSIKENFCVKC